jgi:hypothetical protein
VATVQDLILESGIGYGEDFVSNDHYWADHSAFTENGNTTIAGGIAPMWGCVGVLVASGRGVYTARLWETPTFTGATEEEIAEAEDLYGNMEGIYARRVRGLLVGGANSMVDGKPDAPSLNSLLKDYFPPADDYS